MKLWIEREDDLMTVKDLYEELGKLMKNNPNTINDEIYYFSYDWKVDAINSLNIEYDLDGEGRYIILK